MGSAADEKPSSASSQALSLASSFMEFSGDPPIKPVIMPSTHSRGSLLKSVKSD